ncbi:hypothetical protein PR048_016111 [Dryococelus australis]|uniref:EGF-like domain-containing protein n=1 Tax=Dryococelus australis TaxID=614101 RepID=A0ABQ9HIU9_9NEOP|nr:hypothetical protein PR048_016111 [Dryococelus australis]
MNSTMEPAADEDEDILYQKDASFSAELESAGLERKVQFVTTLSPNLEQKVPSSSGERQTTESLGMAGSSPAPCSLDCGPAGVCLAEPPAGLQRCQCPLGRGGPLCASGKSPTLTCHLYLSRHCFEEGG